jgi:hypothetical protein
VLSNLHAIANLVSGYVRRRRTALFEFLQDIHYASSAHVAREDVEALR